MTRKREPENYILLEIIAPHITAGAAVVLTDACDAKREIAIATSKGMREVLEFYWTQMNAEQIRRSEKYTDGGVDRYEFTELLADLLTLA